MGVVKMGIHCQILVFGVSKGFLINLSGQVSDKKVLEPGFKIKIMIIGRTSIFRFYLAHKVLGDSTVHQLKLLLTCR